MPRPHLDYSLTAVEEVIRLRLADGRHRLRAVLRVAELAGADGMHGFVAVGDVVEDYGPCGYDDPEHGRARLRLLRAARDELARQRVRHQREAD